MTLDFEPLRAALAAQMWRQADDLTRLLMVEAAGEAARQRGWLYFSEVKRLGAEDLRTLDRLWLEASGGRFGFSVQRQLWLAVGQNWEKLWPMLGWKSGSHWTRWPDEFTWDLSAPKGHLPLSNQLRGVQVLAALLTHPAWQP
ncbi:MAG: GUN4 domain-containing protein [Thermostichales cyanobacterium SZTDM-1c_bins_54]